MNSAQTTTGAPLRLWIGALAFLLPLLSLVSLFGISLVSFLFLGSGLILFKPSRDALVRYWPQVRWVVLAFLLHFLFVLACALLRGASMSSVEKPARMLLAASSLAEFARAGKLDPQVLVLPHLHNDGLQVPATGGVVGRLAWAGMLAAPLLFFSRQVGAGMRAPQSAAALAGMFVVLGYLGFGLTEVIFWSVKGSLFYALMVFLLMGFCLNAKEKIG
jgi:hypothetical protein